MRSLIIAAILIIAIIAGGIFLYRKSGPASQNSQITQQITSQSQQEVQITYTANGFSPNPLTVKAGTKVTWLNKSGQTVAVDSDPHPIHTSYPPMNFGPFSDGSSVSLVFDKPGTYRYHNHLNPSQTGTIIVQ